MRHDVLSQGRKKYIWHAGRQPQDSCTATVALGLPKSPGADAARLASFIKRVSSLQSFYGSGSQFLTCQSSDLVDVFVATTREANNDDVARFTLLRSFECVGDRMRSFQGWQYPFGSRDILHGLKRPLVADVDVADSTRVFPVRVFGTDSRIIQSGRDRMHIGGLAVFVLQNVTVSTVQDPLVPEGQGAGVVARFWAASSRFDAGDFD